MEGSLPLTREVSTVRHCSENYWLAHGPRHENPAPTTDCDVSSDCRDVTVCSANARAGRRRDAVKAFDEQQQEIVSLEIPPCKKKFRLPPAALASRPSAFFSISQKSRIRPPHSTKAGSNLIAHKQSKR